MDTRSDALNRIRPDIARAKVREDSTPGEAFQNRTLRPIIKLQNDLLLAAFRNYAVKHKGYFFDLNTEKQFGYIENAIQKDIKFRNALKGMIIGHFTLEEYQEYILNSSALNKRMMNMVIERLKDQLQLLQESALVD